MENTEELYERKHSIDTIILAEDNPADSLAFERALKHVAPQKKLAVVTNGEDLIELLSSYMPDILFMDLDMPMKNGVQCIKELREDWVYTDLPIVVFSATSRPNSVQVAYGFGANLFLVKPTEYHDLVEALQNILRMDWSKPHAITDKYFRNNQYVVFRREDPADQS